MKRINKNTSKIKLYGLVKRKDSTILILEKSEKFKDFLEDFLGESYCDLCLGLDKPIRNKTDFVTNDLGHNYKDLDGLIIYGKNKIFLFVNHPKSISKHFQNLEKFVEWTKVPKHKIESKNQK